MALAATGITPGAYCPIPGMAMRRTKQGFPVVRIHYRADPAHDDEWTKRERGKYTSEAYWNQEMEIQYDAMAGQLIYPEFDSTIHVIPHSRIPRKLCRFMAIDPHPRTPHAFLWLGIDQWSDVYVYQELWPSVAYGEPITVKDDTNENHFTVKQYSETVAMLEGNSLKWHDAEHEHESAEYVQSYSGMCPRCNRPAGLSSPSCIDHRSPDRIIDRYMDQAGKGFIATSENQDIETYADRYYRYGIHCSDPIKSHQAGEDAVHEWLKPRRHEIYGIWPKLHISARCRELILEFLKHRYKVTRTLTGEKELKQDAVEVRSHCLDLLRYLATARISYVSALAS